MGLDTHKIKPLELPLELPLTASRASNPTSNVNNNFILVIMLSAKHVRINVLKTIVL